MSAIKRWLPILAALLLGGCAAADKQGGGGPEGPALPPGFAWADLTAGETEQMANLMGANRALILDGALYSLDFDGDFEPVLARYELEDGRLGERTVLAEDCLPEYLTELDGYLYYVNQGRIERLGLRGEDRLVLRDGSCDFLQIREGRLWFCDEEDRLCRLSPEGGEERTVLEGPCFYPWIRGGLLLWQGGGEEELRLLRLEDGEETVLAAGPCYAPVGLAGRLYAAGSGALIDLRTDGSDRQEWPLPGLVGPVELIPEGDGFRLRWTVEDEKGLRQFTAEPDSPGEARQAPYSGFRRCDYAGGGWRVDAWYQTDGRLRCFVLVSPGGEETMYLNGKRGL